MWQFPLSSPLGPDLPTQELCLPSSLATLSHLSFNSPFSPQPGFHFSMKTSPPTETPTSLKSETHSEPGHCSPPTGLPSFNSYLVNTSFPRSQALPKAGTVGGKGTGWGSQGDLTSSMPTFQL